jgi:hypothetical protein
MPGIREGWKVGRWTVLGLLLSNIPTFRLSAQVGYDPSHSPYRDIPGGGRMTVTFGYLSGSRGAVGVGSTDGPTAGLRYETALGGALGVSVGLGYARTTRFVVDPTKPTASWRTGPFTDGVVLADAGFQLRLTGRKSWHGVAPYLGGALGLAIGAAAPHDTSGYRFGTKFTLMPEVGVRWYPARRTSVRADFQPILWKLRYPLSYKQPNPDGVQLLATTAPLDEYTWHPWVTIGVGWTF